MSKWTLRTIEGRKQYLRDRSLLIQRLRESAKKIESERVDECINEVISAYRKASIIDNVAKIQIENNIEDYRFKSIGFYHAINRNNFLASNYSWSMYFTDVGRAIARGEEAYINKKLKYYIQGIYEKIDIYKPNFRVLSLAINKLLEANNKPNVMFAPIQIFVKYYQHFGNNIKWIDNREVLILDGCELQVFWSNKYNPLRSFVIFNASAGTWHVLADKDKTSRIVMTIGESIQKTGMIEYFVETLANYQVTDRNGFIRVNLV